MKFHDEIYSRVMSCNYEYLFICVPNDRPCLSKIELPNTNPVCLRYQDQDYSKVGDWLSMIVHLPDALTYLLVQRWQRGPLEFSLATLFVLGVLAAIVAAARSGLVHIPLAIVGAPILISIVFWIIQLLLSVVSAGFGYVLAFGLSAAGIAGTLHYLFSPHDLHSLSDVGKKMLKEED